MARQNEKLLPGRVKAVADKLQTGRPRREPPPDAAEVIRYATSTGASKKGVGMALGVDDHILSRWLDEHPELNAAFHEGREKERQTLHNVLYTAATTQGDKGALIAAMFLLKARHGYVEGQQETQANRVSVTFNVPGAQPLDKYLVIDNDPNS